MKIAHLLLAGSLLANAALAGWIALHHRAAPAASLPAHVAPRVDPKAAASEQALARLQAALAAGDAAALSAAGCSPEVARWLIVGRAFDRYQAKMRAAQMRLSAVKYWQHGGLQNREPSREARIEGHKAEHEFSEAVAEAFGENLESMFSNRDSPYAFLPADKIRKLQQIERDYSDMESQIEAEQDGIALPSDHEKLKLMEKEKERDIAAVLSPEEREQLELRTSSTADSIRNRYGDAIETEEQYRKIYAMQKALDDARTAKMEALAGGPTSAELNKWINEQEDQMAEAIKTMVGPDQWARAQQANDQDIRTLASLAQRLNLPENATAATLAARQTYAAQSMAINADPTLSMQDRRKQLQALAKQAQDSLATTLTPDGAQAYAQRASWLNMLRNGQAFSTDPKDAPGAHSRLGIAVYAVPPPKQTATRPGS